MANDYDKKRFDEVMKRAQKALERSQAVRSSRKPSEPRAQDSLSVTLQDSLRVTLEDLRRQNAERFALNQKIRSDLHDMAMSVVGQSREKRPDPGVPSSIGVPTTQVGTAGKKNSQSRRIPLFPNRASWLTGEMLKRGWGKADPSNYGGPDRKTVERILRGESVRNDVLEKLADALSKRQGKISVIDVPQD